VISVLNSTLLSENSADIFHIENQNSKEISSGKSTMFDANTHLISEMCVARKSEWTVVFVAGCASGCPELQQL